MDKSYCDKIIKMINILFLCQIGRVRLKSAYKEMHEPKNSRLILWNFNPKFNPMKIAEVLNINQENVLCKVFTFPYGK